MKFTEEQLRRALAVWDNQSKASGWSERADEERFADTAAYLVSIMEGEVEPA